MTCKSGAVPLLLAPHIKFSFREGGHGNKRGLGNQGRLQLTISPALPAKSWPLFLLNTATSSAANTLTQAVHPDAGRTPGETGRQLTGVAAVCQLKQKQPLCLFGRSRHSHLTVQFVHCHETQKGRTSHKCRSVGSQQCARSTMRLTQPAFQIMPPLLTSEL